jgi:hypothetical protein
MYPFESINRFERRAGVAGAPHRLGGRSLSVADPAAGRVLEQQ